MPDRSLEVDTVALLDVAVVDASEDTLGAESLGGTDGRNDFFGERSALRDVFTNGRSQNFRRAFLGVVNQCFQQISGINIITYYAVGLLCRCSLCRRSS